MASPKGETREYGFQRWVSFDPILWERTATEARTEIRDRTAFPILGSDRDGGAIDAAADNARRAGVSDDVMFDVRSLSSVLAPTTSGLLVANPPYGVRVGEPAPLRNLYAALGKLANSEFHGWDVALMSGDRILEGATGLEFREILKTRNGGIPVRVLVRPG
jgi:putative N6-adenine-specific DNA methylase